MKKFKNRLLLIAVILIITILYGGGIAASARENIKNNIGSLNNLVVYVGFKNAEADSFMSGKDIANMKKHYNASGKKAASVANYFKKVSSGKLKVSGVFACAKDKKNYIELENERGYYLPENYYGGGKTNFKDAYDNNFYISGKVTEPFSKNSKKHIDGPLRENLMVREILEKIDTAKLKKVNLDNDGDGNVDNITFIMGGNVLFKESGFLKSIWGEILWPHMTSLMNIDGDYADSYHLPSSSYLQDNYGIDLELNTYGDVFINDKKIHNYNILSAAYMYTKPLGMLTQKDLKNWDIFEKDAHIGVICHEIMHILGIMDYYSYERHKVHIQSVGKFDLMGSTLKNPQFLLAYTRKKLGYLSGDNFIEAKSGESYTLYPTVLNKKKQAVIIKPDGFDTGEYFMIEARSSGAGIFDKGLGGSGIIVYRIDRAAARENGYMGNMLGDDEIYIYRQFDDFTGGYLSSCDSSLLGEKIKKYGSANLDDTKNTIFFQGTDNADLKGKNSGITISNITVNKDKSVTFKVEKILDNPRLYLN